MVFTSNDLRHALNYADRIVALRQGVVVLDAKCSELDVTTLRALYE
jgi:phosphonate transport system ATP-binding protein